MADIIKAAAVERQGQDWSDSTMGEDLLRDWNIDLSACRTELHVVEIIELILGAPDSYSFFVTLSPAAS